VDDAGVKKKHCSQQHMSATDATMEEQNTLIQHRRVTNVLCDRVRQKHKHAAGAHPSLAVPEKFL
jgi:hypothetical protein